MSKTATGEEAVAVAAAIARFLADTAPAAGEAGAVGPWRRTALLEGVSAKGTIQDREGGVRWLS